MKNTTTITKTENQSVQTEKTVLDELRELHQNTSASELVAVLNKADDKETVKALRDLVEEKVKAENKALVKAGVKAFAMSANDNLTAFWNSFIRNPYVPAIKLTENDETGEFSIEPTTKYVLFSKVDAVYQDEFNGESIANAKNYLRMIARITDNLYRATCSDLSNGVDRNLAVVRVKAVIDGETTMREIDFTKTSNSGICEQMQAFVDTVMPDGQRVLLRNADVTYVRLSIANGKNGKVVTGKEGAVERLMFDAIAKRYTQTAYEVESKAACHKSKDDNKKSERTEKQEEATSKIPERPEATATLSKKNKTEKKAA